jgi:hypothetical protein
MLLGFYKRFVSPIENGTKIQTMRNTPKRMPKIGERLHMYTGPYNEQRKLITKEHTLKSIQTIRVHFFFHKESKTHRPFIWIDNKGLHDDIKEEFYINDGFKDENDFVSFWKLKKEKDCTFIGKLFHWTDFKY